MPADAIAVTAYGELDRYVEKAAAGALGLLLILGRPGTGKTERVRRALGGPQPDKAFYVEGHVQPFGIYHGLWVHRDLPVVLDDADRIYANPDCVRLLKPLCDTRHIRRVSWVTSATMRPGGPPPSFETTSPVILIANDWRSANPNVRALEDRAIILHFDPPNEAVHREVAHWCADPVVYRFIGAHLAVVPAVSMRWYAKAQKLHEAGFREWRQCVRQMMFSDRRLATLAQVLTDPALESDSDRVRAFRRQTGLSQATYYRLKQSIGIIDSLTAPKIGGSNGTADAASPIERDDARRERGDRQARW